MASDVKARLEKKDAELKELAKQLNEVNKLRATIVNKILEAHGAKKELEEMLKDEAKEK